uniref:KA1 domain-containing protein n=1 Tax=Hemiselmis andersenii TaxID=464988 RepID=A0A6U5BK01_HEMAN
MNSAAAAAASKKAKFDSAALCTITNKEPRGVLREVQKLFSDYKVLLRSASPTSLKGEKNRVRFEINVTPIAQVGKTDVKEDLYLVHSNRLAGDVVAFRDVCRRLLIKL